jgi:hypothetical protein
MAVHNFFISTVEMTLGHAVPLAPEVVHPDSSEEAITETLSAMRRWLNVLDLAITPAMIRDSMVQESVPEINQALLRYYIGKGALEGTDRDKADLVVTQLCRHPGQGAVSTLQNLPEHAEYSAVAGAALEFEARLYAMLGDVQVAPLEEHHVQLLREFEFLHHEVEDLRDFQQVLNCGIIARVRTIKDRFGASFYHPDVLATVAVYNVLFGNRFDILFRRATEEIRRFAEKMEQEGASLMSRVEGDVTVQSLKDIEGSAILRAEYRTAKEDLNRVATAKRAVDNRRGSGRAAAPVVAAQTPAPQPPQLAQPQTAAVADPPPGIDPFTSNPVEESKLKAVTDQIRTFVRSSEAKPTTIVPMPKGAITLTLAEADAFRADYRGERSFRADLANIICDIISMDARIASELEEFRIKERSAYLWKPHADSLAYMLGHVGALQHRARAVLEIAQQRGLVEKVNAVNGAAQKLRGDVLSATQALRTMQPGRHH